MRIGIFGRHPVPQPGFMGVMSLFEAVFLSRQGHEVDLLLPFGNPADLNAFLERNQLQSLGDLPRYGGAFNIFPLFCGKALSAAYDVIIYQSYVPEDREHHVASLRKACRVLTKNFPKFVPGPQGAHHETVISSFREFDLVACALLDDVSELKANALFWRQYGHQVAYVPRGADPVLLHPGRKLASTPTVGLEIPPAGNAMRAIDFYVEPLRRLRSEIPHLRILTLGEAPHPDIRSEHISYGRFDQVYERFFNEIWVHLVMDYRHSPSHVSAPVQAVHPADWSARAIYEVQNIEAQMSGAIVIGHPDNVIPELLRPGSSALYFRSYDEPVQIATVIKAGIDHFAVMSPMARAWAEERFGWDRCMALWADAMRDSWERKCAGN